MDGLLIIDKPAGPTSHDVVMRLRRVLGERRIGHTGTLDPAATGVLPLVVGRATRLARFLTAGDKSYEAVIRLGVSTDTADADGAPIGLPFTGTLPSREAVDGALQAFRGTFLQQPPVFSAKKIGGQRSHRLARSRSAIGLESASSVTSVPAPVTVTIHRLDIVSVDQQSDGIGLIKGFGDGTFKKILELPTGSLPSGTAFADANGDGFSDLITCNLRSQDIAVNLSNGNGGFGPAISTSIFPITPSGLAVGDWNRDGKIDVAVVSLALEILAVSLGDGTGHFAAPLQYATGVNPKQVATADFNHDTFADLAVVDNGSSSIQIWRGAGNGQFALGILLNPITGPAVRRLLARKLFGSGNGFVYQGNGSAT